MQKNDFIPGSAGLRPLCASFSPAQARQHQSFPYWPLRALLTSADPPRHFRPRWSTAAVWQALLCFGKAAKLFCNYLDSITAAQNSSTTNLFAPYLA